MKRQRNMAQMKEQNKTPEKELNKMEISNLSDAEFKTLVIRMLKDIIGYFNSIKQTKKTQAEMTLTLNKIKKNLQGINRGVDEVENQINSQLHDWGYDLEHKEEKTIPLEQQKEKRI